MTAINARRAAPALLTCLMSFPVLADIPSAVDHCVSGLSETTPSAVFTSLEGGDVVRHETTGLEWQRCPLGMAWNDSQCSGDGESLTWQDALQLADELDDWRLPDIGELRSIVETCKLRPAINEAVFPNTPSSLFWSASSSSGDNELAWFLDFNDGYGYWGNKSFARWVRLVRTEPD